MNYSLKELLDIPRLRELLDSLDEIHSMPSAILDTGGAILTATAWQDICKKFHRKNPETAKKCIESDCHIEASLDEQISQVIYHCPMGLVDAAMPVIIEGKHLGNVFVGQLFLEPPDEAHFIKQAERYGFDQNEYLAAMRKVPYFSEDKLRKNLTFIHSLTLMLAEQELQYKRQVEAERELQESKKKYQQIFENLQDVYYEADIAGTILEVSSSVKYMSQYQREELIGKSIRDIYTDPNEREELLKNLLTQGKVRDYEIHLNDKDGSQHFCSINARLMKNEQGMPVTIIGSMRNISERKRAEEALRLQNIEYEASQKQLKESEERFRALHDASFGGIGIHDHGLILDCNKGLSDMTGYSSEELIGMDGLKLIAPGSLDQVLHNIERGYDQNYEVEGVRKDGSIYPLAIRGKNIPYKGREVRVIEFRDITERKQAEAALLESERQLKNLLTNMPVALALSDEHQVITFRNKRFVELFGYTEDDVATIADWWPLAYPDEKTRKWAYKTWEYAVRKAIDHDTEIESHEYPVTCKDGMTRIVEISGIMLGKEMLMTFNDVTERKRLEEERQTIEKLRSIGTLAGGLAHDFNNILAGLYGNISLAKAKLSKDYPDHPGFRFIEAAEKSMNSAILLTNQLLTFAKGGAPVRESLSLGSLVDEVVQFNLSGSKVKPVITQAGDLWLAKADQGQIQQVFGNLTINAKQAMTDGGHLQITLENAEITKNMVPGLDEGRYIRVTVTDEGTGIAPEHLDRIFDPYFTTKQAGSGLGLATIYSIIKRHGGHISVASQLGIGTTFTFYLPASEAAELPDKQSEIELSLQRQSAKILVMDDEEVIRSTVAAMLEDLGFSVATAAEGKQAAEFYRQALEADEPFDLVILDLTIPGGIGGTEVAQKILQIDSNARMIVSSGYADDPIMAKCADFGFKGVVTKPYNLKKLSAVLTRVLGE